MTGAAQVNATLKNVSESIWEAVCKAVDEATTEVKEDSQENFIPIDKGDLKASCTQKNIEDSHTKHMNEISVGEGLDYAIYVHEILSYYHPHGSAKYLEKPLNSHEQDIIQKVSSAVGSQLDG